MQPVTRSFLTRTGTEGRVRGLMREARDPRREARLAPGPDSAAGKGKVSDAAQKSPSSWRPWRRRPGTAVPLSEPRRAPCRGHRVALERALRALDDRLATRRGSSPPISTEPWRAFYSLLERELAARAAVLGRERAGPERAWGCASARARGSRRRARGAVLERVRGAQRSRLSAGYRQAQPRTERYARTPVYLTAPSPPPPPTRLASSRTERCVWTTT